MIQFTCSETKKADDLDFLQDVVSELLAVGKVEGSSTIVLQKPLRKPLSVEPKERLPRSAGSIENFFDNLETQAEIYAKSLNIQDNDESSASEAENDVFSTEGNDSGIDETMPGVTKDTTHKRSSSSRNRKQHDSNENRVSKKQEHREKDKVKRSESEPKKSKKHGKKSKSSGDVTVRIDGVDYSGPTLESQTGRSKERRSEPLIGKPSVDTKVKVKSRKSDAPLSSNSQPHHSKSRHRNDLDGGQIENQERLMSDSLAHKQHKERSKSPEKKDHNKHRSKTHQATSTSATLKTHGESHRRRAEGAEVKQENSVKNPSKTRNEYARDTADGSKHAHVVRPQKNPDDPGPLPKKEHFRDFDDDNIRSMVRGKRTDEDLVRTLGVTPDILKLLREEEKFWQRQQELKEWRQAKDSTYKRPPYSTTDEGNHQNQYAPPPPREESKYNGVHFNKNNSAPTTDAEVLREAAENRLAMQAEKLMKVRAEQQQILRTSRENLLEEPDRPPPPRNYNKSSSRSSSSAHSNSRSSSSFPPTPTSPASEHALYPSSPQYANLPHTQLTGEEPPPPVDRTHKSRTRDNKLTTETKVVPLMGAFSDDEGLLSSTGNRMNPALSPTPDYRGYFSDDGFRDNTISKTHLARPVFRQPTQTIRCTHCGDNIRDNRMIVVEKENYHWHPACFRCVVCRTLLNDSGSIRVRMVGTKLHCRYCTSARNGEFLFTFSYYLMYKKKMYEEPHGVISAGKMLIIYSIPIFQTQKAHCVNILCFSLQVNK